MPQQSNNPDNQPKKQQSLPQQQQIRKIRQNEHIPRYIKSQPWYYQSLNSNDYLIHHRQSQDKKKLFDIENNREAKVGGGINDKFVKKKVISIENYNKYDIQDTEHKFCENCGQLDHLRKDCLERPRKIKNKNVLIQRHNIEEQDNGEERNNKVLTIRDDENLDWDAKKDRWYGYTGEDYDNVVHKWQANNNENASEPATPNKYDRDEKIELFKLGLIKDSKGLIRQHQFSEQERNLGRTTVRLREDKAVYLNDINSSRMKYDPKSRVYKTATTGYIDSKTKMFRRHLTGEGLQLEHLSRFNRRYARQQGINDALQDKRKIEHVLIANPTKYEKLMRETKQLQQQQKQQENSTSKTLIDYSQLEAQKIKGKKQDSLTKKVLETMYE